MDKLELPTHSHVSVDQFKQEITSRKPFIVRNFNIGTCSQTWTLDYLALKGGDRPVKVHVTEEQNMNFIEKNFSYKTLPFNELISRLNSDENNDYFFSPKEQYYLRSLGFDARGKDVANLQEHWPDLSSDLTIPEVFDKEQFFSSVLRVSSSCVRMWTHYDVMDNILIQVRGRKEVILWHPQEADNLYLKGDKSRVLNVVSPDDTEFPDFKNALQHVGIMEEGDILFIPALWFHNTYALSPSIAVNVFWKNLDPKLYDSKDPYGNKDPLPAAKAFLATKGAMKSLEVLPTEYQCFYLRRMMQELKERLSYIESSSES